MYSHLSPTAQRHRDYYHRYYPLLPSARADEQLNPGQGSLDYFPTEDYTISQPEDYEFWRRYQADFWPGPQLGWIDTHPETLETRFRPLFERPDWPDDRAHADDLWHYRRIFSRELYPAGLYPSDITLVNWPQNDYWLGPIAGVSEEEKQKHLRAARQLSLSLLYWMQTQAPRIDGGYRLHPVEWNIGEASGALAAYCLSKGLAPMQVRNTPQHLADFQAMLTSVLGFELAWSESVRTESI